MTTTSPYRRAATAIKTSAYVLPFLAAMLAVGIAMPTGMP